MTDEASLSELVGLIHEAPLQPELWQTALQRCASLFNVSGAHLFWPYSLALHKAEVITTFTPECLLAFEQYISRNELMKRLPPPAPGMVVTDQMMMPRPALEKTEIFNEFFVPFDLFHQTIGVFEVRGPEVSGLVLSRSRQGGAFEADDLQLYRYLLPHLAGAARMARRLGNLELQRDAAWDTLASLERAVFLVDGHAGILFASKGAEIMARERDGVAVVKSRLTASHAAETATLHRLIVQASSRELGRRLGEGAGGSIALTRPSGRRPLAAMVSPLESRDRAYRAIDGKAGAIVSLTDPDRVLRLPGLELQVLYGLTRAEVALARELAQGLGLTEAAARLAISRATAASQLGRIFDKTGTTRQAQLILLIAGLP